MEFLKELSEIMWVKTYYNAWNIVSAFIFVFNYQVKVLYKIMREVYSWRGRREIVCPCIFIIQIICVTNKYVLGIDCEQGVQSSKCFSFP